MQTSDWKKMGKILKRCVVKGKKPTKVWFEVTDKCNSHCRTCGIWKKIPTLDPLTPDEIFTLFSDQYLSEVDYVIVSGGEPMMREDIVECVLAIDRALPGVAINFSTNGLAPLLTYAAIEELLGYGVNLSVGTSIDAIGKKHDAIRGVKGAWDNVRILLNLLMKLRCKTYPNLQIGFGTVLQKENQDDIDEIIKFAESNGLFYLIQHQNRSGFYGNCTSTFADWEKEVLVVAGLPERFNMLKEKWLDHMAGYDISFNCYALRDFFVLKCNGDIAPCLTHWDAVVGNIREEEISDILPQEMLDCPGCLNSWGTFWSWEADGLPYLIYYIKHPIKLWRKICGSPS
jgi:MoaA/NifB/PqqE/SkfB family radical SAM enzyme